MEERFAIRSGFLMVIVILAGLCDCTEQRLSERHPRSLNSKYRGVDEDAETMKKLMEMLLMQHNEFPETDALSTDIETNEEENATERPPTGANRIDDVLQPASAGNAEDNSIDRLPISIGISLPLNQPKPDVGKYNTNTNKSSWEITTMEPQQLASPLDDTNEYNFETTTIQPERIMGPIQWVNSGAGVVETTQSTSSYLVNIPPTKSNKKNTKRTTTKSPHVVSRPQPANTFSHQRPAIPVSFGNPGKIKIKPDQKIDSLKPADRDHDVRGEIQLETLNRPISTRRPLATVTPGRGGNATSSQPNKKPINIIPTSIVTKVQKPSTTGVVDKPQGTGGVHNPIPNSVAAATPSDSDDYLLSALASIGDDEENDGDEGDEEEEEDEEDNEDEEEEAEEEDEEEEEYEYPTDSTEQNEERTNFDSYINSLDASDVISSVMEEVGALL